VEEGRWRIAGHLLGAFRICAAAPDSALLGQANLLPSIVSATTKVPPFDLANAFMSSMNCP
jgi:hypothetical protein